MRTITKKLLTGIIFFSSASSANNIIEKGVVAPDACLEIVGIALGENNEAIDGVEVKLFKENEEMEWIEITSITYHDHNFSFTLDVDSYYTIEVTKPGFIKRSVAISTKLPSDVSTKTPFKYGFELVLMTEKKEVNEFYIDFPVALISYNPQSEVFENSSTYTKHIKTKMKGSGKKVKSENTTAKN